MGNFFFPAPGCIETSALPPHRKSQIKVCISQRPELEAAQIETHLSARAALVHINKVCQGCNDLHSLGNTLVVVMLFADI